MTLSFFGERVISFTRIGRGRLLFELPQAKAEGAELLLDFAQAGLAEVFAAEELGLGAAGQLADGGDVEALERLAASDGEFEVGDGLTAQFGGDVAGRHAGLAERATGQAACHSGGAG